MISSCCLGRVGVRRLPLRHCSTSEQQVYDVVIHGGGVVGAALAKDLVSRSQGRCKVCLIEAGSVRHISSPQPDARVYALSPRSISQLDKLGAWKHIAERSQPYSSMQIWEASGPGLVKFRAHEMGRSELGRVAEDATIQAALFQAIADSEHRVDVLNQSSILEIKSAASSRMAEVLVKSTAGGTESERRISTRLLVGADGANSLVRRLTGIPSWGWSYGAEAVVATVCLQNPAEQQAAMQTDGKQFDNSTAWQRYLPTGPLALLPAWQGYSSIVWSVSVPEARRLKALAPEAFLDELNAALRSPVGQTEPVVEEEAHSGRTRSGIFPPWVEAVLEGPAGGGLRMGSKVLHGISKELSAASEAVLAMAQLRDPYTAPPLVKQLSGPRVSFPLQFQQAKYYALNRCALVGDAAHSIHPQAGQGLNLGLQDAAALCSHVIAALESGRDIGHNAVLQDYANERFTRNLAMMSIVDLLNTTFKDSIVLSDQIAADNKLDANSPPVKVKRFLRSIGMLGINNSAMLKAEIAKFAMGTE